MEMGKTAAMAACGFLVACLVGCKTPVPAGPDAESLEVSTSPDEPKWVSAGARAFPEEAGKALCGIGVAAANRFPADPFMLRKTATERGRAEVAAQLRTLVASVLMDYAEAAFAPGMKPDEMQSLTENVQESVADAALIGAQPAAAWKDPQTGATYVLVKLGLDGVAQQLRDKIIAAEGGKLKMDADAAHKELDSIIEKNRQRTTK